MSGSPVEALSGLVFASLIALVVSLGLVPALKPAAQRLGLVDAPDMDAPDRRKHHRRPAMLVGGAAMYLAFSAGVLGLPGLPESTGWLLACALILVATGIADDRYGLSTRTRFAAQIGAGLLMCLGAGVCLRDMGALRFDGGMTELGLWTVPVTVFCVVGVINAINMLDGLDGLAAGAAIIGGGIMSACALAAGRVADAGVLAVFCAAVAGFWCWNVRWPGRAQAGVFMGDGGSLMLGLVLAWHVVALSQGEQRVFAPAQALWFLAVPLFDTVRLLVWRPALGASPFGAGRDHLHHLCRFFGWSHGACAWRLLALTLLMALLGAIAPRVGVSEFQLFYAFMALFTLYALAAGWVWVFRVDSASRDDA